jgi:amino acid transporter
MSALIQEKNAVYEKSAQGDNDHIAEDVNEGQTSSAIGGLLASPAWESPNPARSHWRVNWHWFSIAIGSGLYKGGSASLLIAFAIESLMVGMLNNYLAEMTTSMLVSGGFIRLAGKWVDEAWGFMAGWHFFIYMALTVPFEISTVNLPLDCWRDDIPVVAVCMACIVAYA